MKTDVTIGKNIFPSFEDILPQKVNEILEKYGVSVQFLFEDGVRFSYDSDRLNIEHYPGDLSFYDSKTNSRLLTFLENIDELQFYGDDEDIPIIKLEICDTIFEYIKFPEESGEKDIKDQ